MAKKRTANSKSQELQALKKIERMVEESSVEVHNAVQSRSHHIEKLLDPRRDIDDDCGYPHEDALTVDDFWQLYSREGVAERVNDILPEECWKSTPSVYETDDTDDETEFELAFKNLLKEEFNHYSPEEQCHPLWNYLERVDKLSGIGRYGLILLGLTDGKDFSEPVDASSDLAYIRVFSELDAKIGSIENDRTNERFGQPLSYHITTQETDQTQTSMTVHWTRIIHITDKLQTKELYATPRLKVNYNRLYDLRKLHGGSAEMYWRGAFPGLGLKPNANLDLETVTIDKSALRDSIEQYMNTLQRYFYAEGLEAQMLAPTVVDPSPQIRVQIEAICIQLGCPLRIFMGSERGELASSQDSDSWESRLKKRRSKYIAPNVIAKVINRLIKVGALPVPTEGFKIKWEKTQQLSEETQAKIAELKIKAIAAYIQSDSDNLIAPEDLLVRFLGFSKDEANEIIEAAEKYIEENPDGLIEADEDENLMNQSFQEGGNFNDPIKKNPAQKPAQ